MNVCPSPLLYGDELARRMERRARRKRNRIGRQAGKCFELIEGLFVDPGVDIYINVRDMAHIWASNQRVWETC
jgi:hypothetical protein